MTTRTTTRRRRMHAWIGTTTLLLIVTATTVVSFVPSMPVRARLPRLDFSNGDIVREAVPLQLLSPLTPVDDKKQNSFLPESEEEETQVLQPFSTERSLPTVQDQSSSTWSRSIANAWKGLGQLFRNFFQKLRPSQQFRVKLGLGVLATLSIVRVFGLPLRLLSVKSWIATRGFTGLAALGRSITYGWGLFVAYPKMLDRRAQERKKRDKERAVDLRRQQLATAAAEVARLRQEVATLDSEIRSFRREIIAMKAYTAKEEDPSSSSRSTKNAQVQEAIDTEMGHLVRLRSEVQVNLQAARQALAERRASSPPEALDEEPLLF